MILKTLVGMVFAALLGFGLGRGDGVKGYADWHTGDSRPYGWVRSDLILEDPIGAAMVALHEEQHVSQLRVEADNSVESRSKAIAGGPERMKHMEAEAYCVSARAAVYFGRISSLDEAIEHYAGTMTDPSYPFTVTREEAKALIQSYCD